MWIPLDARPMRIGELLQAQGLLTAEQVDAVLIAQESDCRPFGALCEAMFGVDPSFVEAAWVDQYRALARGFDGDLANVDPKAAALISRRQAWQFRIVPLRIEDCTLVAATTGRHLSRASRFTAAVLGRPALFVIVEPDELAGALEAIYPIDGLGENHVRAQRVADPLGPRG